MARFCRNLLSYQDTSPPVILRRRPFACERPKPKDLRLPFLPLLRSPRARARFCRNLLSYQDTIPPVILRRRPFACERPKLKDLRLAFLPLSRSPRARARFCQNLLSYQDTILLELAFVSGTILPELAFVSGHDSACHPEAKAVCLRTAEAEGSAVAVPSTHEALAPGHDSAGTCFRIRPRFRQNLLLYQGTSSLVP